MSAPKIIGAVLLSIILFISLCVFSVALTVKVTALSSSYVTSLVEDIPVSEILEEAGRQGDNSDSRQLDIIKGIIDNNETVIKERIVLFVSDVYDYLNSKSDDIDIAQVLGNTVLDGDFATSLVAGSDLKPLLEEFIQNMIQDKGLPAGLSLDDYIDDIAAQTEPWAKEQAGIVIPPVLDYVLGNSDTFSVSVSLDELKQILKENLKQSFLASPPPKYQGLSQAELGQTFDALFEQYSGEIPSSYVFDEQLFTSEDGTSMTIDVSELEQVLRDSKKGIVIFNIAFIALIVLIILLIAGIILIYRDIKWSALNLGVVSFVFGAGLMVFYFSSQWMIRDFLAQQEIASNSAIRDWLTSMSDGTLFPMLIQFICFIAIGIALLVIYFVYRRRQHQDEAPVYSEKIEYRENDRGDTSV
jgi:Ca2+/Na+ antiporter